MGSGVGAELGSPGLGGEMCARAWREICCSTEYRGRWVALASCEYGHDGPASVGAVVDSDEDLVALCARLRASAKRNCAIHFAGES